MEDNRRETEDSIARLTEMLAHQNEELRARGLSGIAIKCQSSTSDNSGYSRPSRSSKVVSDIYIHVSMAGLLKLVIQGCPKCGLCPCMQVLYVCHLWWDHPGHPGLSRTRAQPQNSQVQDVPSWWDHPGHPGLSQTRAQPQNSQVQDVPSWWDHLGHPGLSRTRSQPETPRSKVSHPGGTTLDIRGCPEHGPSPKPRGPRCPILVGCHWTSGVVPNTRTGSSPEFPGPRCPILVGLPYSSGVVPNTGSATQIPGTRCPILVG